MELLQATVDKPDSLWWSFGPILQVPFVDESHIMNVYKVYNLPMLLPVLQKTFPYSIEGEYLTL